MINIEQVKKDFDNGVIISRETIRQVIEMAANQENMQALIFRSKVADLVHLLPWDLEFPPQDELCGREALASVKRMLEQR